MSLDGINGPVDSDVTKGVITTRSNRMKFRLSAADKFHQALWPSWELFSPVQSTRSQSVPLTQYSLTAQ